LNIDLDLLVHSNKTDSADSLCPAYSDRGEAVYVSVTYTHQLKNYVDDLSIFFWRGCTYIVRGFVLPDSICCKIKWTYSKTCIVNMPRNL